MLVEQCCVDYYDQEIKIHDDQRAPNKMKKLDPQESCQVARSTQRLFRRADSKTNYGKRSCEPTECEPKAILLQLKYP